jgi:V/A-type H+/Na+-transporting ATPase subunit E
MEANDIPDVQLKELIDTIQRDGVDKAHREGDELLKQAREKADGIVAAAQAQADALLANARREQERLERSGREALRQASRDLLLGVRKQLEVLFAALLKEKSRDALGDKAITAAIVSLISNWTPERQDKIEILLPKERFDPLAQALRQALAGKIAAGIEIKPAADVTDGFRVSEKDGHAYYDFSAASIAESLALFLNPAMAGIVADALRQDA